MRGNALPAAPQTQALTIFIPCHQLPHRYLSYRELTLILSSVVMRFGGKLKVSQKGRCTSERDVRERRIRMTWRELSASRLSACNIQWDLPMESMLQEPSLSVQTVRKS